MEANTIISEVEEDDFVACTLEGRMESNDEKESNMPKTPSQKRSHDRWKEDDEKLTTLKT